MTAEAGERAAASRSVPVLVWALTAIFALRGVFSVLGAFIFAFPFGSALGIGLGVFLLLIGAAYLVIAWRFRLGERTTWMAAIAVPLINQGALAILDLSLYGTIPPEDYLFIGVTVVVLVILFLPPVRRFFHA